MCPALSTGFFLASPASRPQGGIAAVVSAGKQDTGTAGKQDMGASWNREAREAWGIAGSTALPSAAQSMRHLTIAEVEQVPGDKPGNL